MSEIRKNYFVKFIFRCVVLVTCAVLCFAKPDVYNVIDGINFFKTLSPLHILWFVWMIDMFMQIIPAKSHIALGSKKLFANHFKPIKEKPNRDALKKYIISTTKSAYLIFIVWCAMLAVVGALYYLDIINKIWLFMISVAFYVCDLICVLFWCPFRLILKNRCCTTCRIFNWDHIMMFSPIIFLGGFYAISLVVMAFITWGVWELSVLLHPERFWSGSNEALKCSQCTDKLCTQYCNKLKQ